MNVMGIIFANDDVTNELTTKRTMASLPFGGRYRQVDFQLANLTAGGVRHLGIVSRSTYQSLMNHIGSGEEWGLEMGVGGLEFLTPGALGTDDRYRGKLENLHAIIGFLAPRFYLRSLKKQRLAKFNEQLEDALLSMSSALKADADSMCTSSMM